MYVGVYVLFVFIYVCMYVFMYTGMYACMYIYIYVYTYVCTNGRNLSHGTFQEAPVTGLTKGPCSILPKNRLFAIFFLHV